MNAQNSIKTLTIRFDLDTERDRNVWDYIHTTSKQKHRTCNNAVIEDLSEHIRSLRMQENLNNSLACTVRNAIREEFARIISPGSKAEHISAPIQNKEHNSSSESVLRELMDSDIFDG